MKISAAFCALIATIGTAPCAHARISSLLSDPRNVEVKDDVRRITMGEKVLDFTKDKASGNSDFTCQDLITEKEGKLMQEAGLDITTMSPDKKDTIESLACSSVSARYPVCLGCQGYTLVEKNVIVPGCIGMTPTDCIDLAKQIVIEDPTLFKDPAAALVPETLDLFTVGNTYYALALPVLNGQIKGISKDGACMVHYAWDWCVNDISGSVKCIKIGPFDCSVDGNGGDTCLSSDVCCARIQDGNHYPAPDINSNRLQCYEWEIPQANTPQPKQAAQEGEVINKANQDPVGMVGNRIIMRTIDGKVQIPAILTDENYEVDKSKDEVFFMDEQTLNVASIFLKEDGKKCMKQETNDNVLMADCDPADLAVEDQQEFYYDSATMQIRSFDGKCLDYDHESSNDNVRMHTCDVGLGLISDNQKWRMTPKYELRTFHNEHCLDMNKESGDLYMNSCHEEYNQKFVSRIPISRDGAIRSEGKCMERGSDDNIYMRDCIDSTVQQFSYDATTKQIRRDGKCLDYNYSNDNVELNANCHGDPNQKWYMTKNNELKTKHDEKCLDINYGDGDNLYMYECHGESNQKFESDIPITAE